MRCATGEAICKALADVGLPGCISPGEELMVALATALRDGDDDAYDCLHAEAPECIRLSRAGPGALLKDDLVLAAAADAAVGGSSRTTRAPNGTFLKCFSDAVQSNKASSHLSNQRVQERKAGGGVPKRQRDSCMFPDGADSIFHSVILGRSAGGEYRGSGAVREACEQLQKLPSCTPDQHAKLQMGIDDSKGWRYDAVWDKLDRLKVKRGLAGPKGGHGRAHRRPHRRRKAARVSAVSSVGTAHVAPLADAAARVGTAVTVLARVAELAADMGLKLCDARAVLNSIVENVGRQSVVCRWVWAEQMHEMALRFDRLNALQGAVDGVHSAFAGACKEGRVITADTYDVLGEATDQLCDVADFAAGLSPPGLLGQCQTLLYNAEVGCSSVADALQIQ